MEQYNIAEVNEAVAAANPDRAAIITADRTITYAELTARTRRFANALHQRGFGAHTERAQLPGHESGQDHLAIYLHNGPEYIESMLGAFKARVAPFNVNYRYVAEELRYLLDNAKARIVVYHDAFAPTLAEVLADLPDIALLVQVPDDSGNDLLPGAIRYDDLLAEGSEDPVPVQLSPDDLYILYTGGTTGMPKGVLWRQHDIFISAMGGRPFGQTEAFPDLASIVEASKNGGARMMSVAPLMHGAAQWATFTAFTGGNTIVFPTEVTRLDPHDVLSTVEREKVLTLQIVGDAMGRPLIEALEQASYDLSGLLALVSGGAALNTALKDRFLEVVPHAVVLDAVGSSETGAQMGHTSMRGATATGTFTPGPETSVVNADLTGELAPGSDETGWLAQRGHVPLGYLGDEAKTNATFPVINGTRYAVPGDRANWRADGIIELLGRDSVTINSGGEKIYAEEVEQAIARHPKVYDVIVVGRPSERWGSEVVAVVQTSEGETVTAEELLEEIATSLARYKLPKAFVFRETIVRSPAGKADYRWARGEAEAEIQG
ncbi:MAG TPA: acyl-CoA synthetase [Acidimicrobiales bacterium]|nr:acyl-CoA synthetase [Acidimicrobiales bacterium]HRA34988.1 acyl-CoA synthetase [Acidimicrobiales bacterium]